MAEMTDRAEEIGRRAQNSDWLDWSIRAGLVAYGIVHLLIGWLALQLAFGDRSENASNTGAMQELARQPYGEVLVWAIAIGMFLLVIWRILEALFGHLEKEEGGERLRARAVSAGKAVIYAAVGIAALNVVIGSKSSKGGSSWTKTVMGWPAGQWIIAAVGLAVIAYGANHVFRGFTEKYAKHLDAEGKSGHSGKAYLLFGKIGYIGKGVAIAIVGSADPVRRSDSRRQQVRQSRPGAPEAVDLSLRPGPARGGRSRHHLLRAVLLRPRAPPQQAMTADVDCDVVVLGLGPGGEHVAIKLARAGLDVIGVEDRLVGGECPYYGCVPSKMMIAAAHVIADVHKVPRFGGKAEVEPDWATVAQRIRDEATDDWDDAAAVKRLEDNGGTFRARPGRARRTRPGPRRRHDVRRPQGRRAQHRHRARRTADRRPAGDAVLDQPRRRRRDRAARFDRGARWRADRL